MDWMKRICPLGGLKRLSKGKMLAELVQSGDQYNQPRTIFFPSKSRISGFEGKRFLSR